MTSKPVAFLMADLGITKTHSRPYTSNDNPYIKRHVIPPGLRQTIPPPTPWHEVSDKNYLAFLRRRVVPLSAPLRRQE
jgi:hypothetical protein